ncbi:helix-turn-helix domain-containing protein [Pseudoblastomonas halimionae]|uniref:DUF4019 domain-containing protein n=1 Tax=Alteriqipengyuania halimionae TaxID=1926630 RepID=A0A6I4U111_9SPHN|nr:DUF4019 domain-containing protein [Alteriqipengyuania halimionae]MXP09660.1 DUF4019 domain-containing protein [Alteriqipengyuania halimionae]
MTQPGVDDLTDKEKEALRLLLAGHDAKSSAAELDLSVHTINDRLRNARRKLGVSSSREAARILGDIEGETPQNPAHTGFGMGADIPADDTAVLTNQSRAGASRSIWLAGGMLVMSIFIAAAIIGLTFTGGDDAVTPTSTASAPVTKQRKDAAKPASYNRAMAFLAEVDAGDWQGSYDTAGNALRAQSTLEEWVENVVPVRAPLGEVENRRLSSVERVGAMPGQPSGETEVLQFSTQFEGHEGRAVETVVMVMGQAGWEVSLYFVT